MIRAASAVCLMVLPSYMNIIAANAERAVEAT
jgi:hypothetical protein